MSTIIGENRAYWGKRAASYSIVNQGELTDEHRDNWKNVILKLMSDHFPGTTTDSLRVLDIGTGPGFFAIILCEAGCTVTAVDLTPNMLAEAKKNAGILAEKIDFLEMDAEALTFPDGSFDVIVTRNLTWNLPHPEKAYGEWIRVLKKGGLLLNFDANWYGYLFDDAAKAAYIQDRENTAAQGFEDQNVGDNFDVMEDIARRIPLSQRIRPEWDEEILRSMGVSVSSDREIWQMVWSEAEKSAFASTPMFVVKAVR